MTNYKKKSIFALVLFLLVLYACMDEVSDAPPTSGTSITVEEAMNYFNSNVKSFRIRPKEQTRNADEELLVTPLWEKGKTVLFRNKNMAEIPVYAPITVITPKSEAGEPLVKDKYIHVNTSYNLLAEKQVDGSILFTIAKITCDLDYLKKRKRKRDTFMMSYDYFFDFTGTVRYYSLEGEFITGFDYKNGKRIAIITSNELYDPNKKESSLQKATRGGEECWTVFYNEYTYSCYDVFNGGELMNSGCEYRYDGSYSETYCRYVDTGDDGSEDSGGSGGGSGGNPPAPDNPPTEPCTMAELLRGNSEFKTQYDNMFTGNTASVEESIANLINYLNNEKTGLSVIFVETDQSTNVININWTDFKPREINSNNELTIKNCNQ